MSKNPRTEKTNNDDDQKLTTRSWLRKSPLTDKPPDNTSNMYFFNIQTKTHTICKNIEDAFKVILSGYGICEHFTRLCKTLHRLRKIHTL